MAQQSKLSNFSSHLTSKMRDGKPLTLAMQFYLRFQILTLNIVIVVLDTHLQIKNHLKQIEIKQKYFT
jgi:hypothetical protein